MESTYSAETIWLVHKTKETVERIIMQSEMLTSSNDYLSTPWGKERLESTSMLLIAIGESLKGIDKLTDKKLLTRYPEVDWKGAKGLRDIIAHNYFELDEEVIFEVVKNELPIMYETLCLMIEDINITN